VCARHEVVWDALADGIEVDQGTAVASLEQPADGSVRVRFTDGSEERTDFVVAADGVHSTVRDVGPAAPRASRMTTASWRFVTTTPGIASWTAWPGRGRTSLLVPVAPGEVYAYASSSQGGHAGTAPSWLADAYVAFPKPVTRAIGQALASPSPP